VGPRAEVVPVKDLRCPGGRPPEMCCVGRPWEAADLASQVLYWGEPLPQAVIDTAVRHGLDPHALDEHVEAVHGWEPHNNGFAEAVEVAARCILADGCLISRPVSG